MRYAILVVLLAISVSQMPMVVADLRVEGNSLGGNCTPLISTLRTRWADVKYHMMPPSGDIRNPKQEDFVCVSRQVLREATERRITTSANLRCFTAPFSRGLGICCDDPVTACTQLHPGLFPELQQRGKDDEAYEPPKSNWVKPPSDGDQWGSN